MLNLSYVDINSQDKKTLLISILAILLNYVRIVFLLPPRITITFFIVFAVVGYNFDKIIDNLKEFYLVGVHYYNYYFLN